MTRRTLVLFALVAGLLIATGLFQSWNTALTILNMGLVSAVMALGLNIQWGFAGLFNVGVMGFVALGGLAAVLIAEPPVAAAWAAGGGRMMAALAVGALVIALLVALRNRLAAGWRRGLILIAVAIAGFLAYRALFDPARDAIEAVDPASTGYLGGLGLPILLSWPVGGLLAAGAAWVIGKTALGLRSDYLAIATLGISEILVSVLRNEDWLSRGVKNVVGLPRPVPYEIDLQQDPGFMSQAAGFGLDPVTASTLYVKLLYTGVFAAVLILLVVLTEAALKAPWGRMMRAIRDNETAAAAMGKNVTRRHLQVFVLGSAVCGIAGAMMTTLDSQLTPGTYQPLRFTFLIWVMVIVGGSGNTLGSVLGGMLVWLFWIEVEHWGQAILWLATLPLPDGALKAHLLDSAQHMRLLTMGLVLLLVMRFAPRGLLPER